MPLILSNKIQPRVEIHFPPHNHNNIHQNFPFITFTENDSFLTMPATLWSHQHQQCHWTSRPVTISPPSFLSLVFQYFLSWQARVRPKPNVYVYTCDTLYVDPCPIVRVCVYLLMSVYKVISICLEVSTKSYHNTVESHSPLLFWTDLFYFRLADSGRANRI